MLGTWWMSPHPGEAVQDMRSARGSGCEGVGTRARQGCARGDRARLRARRARARQCDGVWR
eukprot:6296063-Prymnesium_polylepis.1